MQCTQWSQGGSKVNKRKLKFVLLIESIPLFDYLRHRVLQLRPSKVQTKTKKSLRPRLKKFEDKDFTADCPIVLCRNETEDLVKKFR